MTSLLMPYATNPLVPDPVEMIMAIIFVVILTVIIAKFVVPRFEATYAERTAAIQGGMEKAEKAQEEAEAALKQYQAQLAEARSEAAKIREDAKTQGTQIIAELREQAQAESARIRQAAESQLEAERTQVMTQLRSEIGGLATTLAGRIVGESLDDDERARRTVDRFLKFLLRRAAGYQAYYEHMPLRRSSLPSGPDMLLHRRLEFGRLASFNVLDTRQYRSDQLGKGAQAPTPALLDPNRTILGEKQRQWLYDGLDRSTANWNILAQQVMMTRVDFKLGPGEEVLMDKWSGYEDERSALIRHFREHRTVNPIVITGDIHTNWANEVSGDPDRADGSPVAVEFVGTSISSVGRRR